LLLIMVHYLDIWHPNIGFYFSSVEISSSVDCGQGKEQPTNKRVVSLFFVVCIAYCSHTFLSLRSYYH